MDNVVVIGGSGFLGSHVADELSVRGYQVTVFDQKPSLWIRNDQTFVEGDILDRAALSAVIDGARFVYHFGGVADIKESLTDPYRTLEVNILGTANALEALKGSSVERFLYASTMYVYSDAGSFYRASKQSAEAIVEAYCEAKELGYTFLRYGSLYGPRAQEWNGLRSYVRQVIEKGQLDYPGSGDERREYIHVKDAARLSADVLDPRHRNQAITVTGAQVLNSKDLAEMIFEIAGKTPSVSFSDNTRRQEHYRITPYRYSPSQARKLVPSEFVDLGQGILELCEELNLELDAD